MKTIPTRLGQFEVLRQQLVRNAALANVALPDVPVRVAGICLPGQP